MLGLPDGNKVALVKFLLFKCEKEKEKERKTFYCFKCESGQMKDSLIEVALINDLIETVNKTDELLYESFFIR